MSDDSRRPAKTAGIIIIGNEILSGKVHDSNSFFLLSELRELGVSVMRLCVIPDEMETIGSEAAFFSKTYDYVFTSGGIGPTHDDITMAGIAKGFGVNLARHPELEKRFRQRYGDTANDAVMRMAGVPEGAELIEVGDLRFPIVAFRNIIILPGIPKFFREKFSLIRERFRSMAFFLKKIFLDSDEAEIAQALTEVAAAYPDVSFGSYPVLDNPDYKIMVTAESKSEDSLKKGAAEFIERIPQKAVVRVE